MIPRRALLAGLATLAAPAIIRTPGLLMPVRVERRLGLDDDVEWGMFGIAEMPEEIVLNFVPLLPVMALPADLPADRHIGLRHEVRFL